jgi:hypothetical protein
MRANLLFLLSPLIVASPAHAATRNFGITGFEKIRVEGAYRVRLTTGVAPYATASGSPAALDRLSIETRGNTLVVHSSLSSWGGYPGRDSGPVEIRVGTHDLSSAWISGSGSLAIDKVKALKFDLSVQGSGNGTVAQVNVDQLSVSVVGTANASLAGQAGKMTAVVRGVSGLDAAGLSTKDATIGAEGSATVAANVTDSATVDGSGAITVKFTGHPSCTLRVSGSASVSGCR